MKRGFVYFLVALLAFPPLAFGQQAQEKPVAALGRVAVLGDISEVQQRVIANRLRSILAQSYSLVSQEQYEKAEQAAFETLDLAQCTEEECVRKIQELLQVDRLIILQILREADFTQLTLNMMKMDSTDVVDGVCEKCSISQLYQKIDELAQRLVAQDIKAGARELIAAQPAPAPAPAVEEEDEGGISWLWWVLGGPAIAGLAAASSSSSSTESSPTCPAAECGDVVVNY